MLVKSGMHEDQRLFGLKSQWSLGWFIQARDYLDSTYKTKCLVFYFYFFIQKEKSSNIYTTDLHNAVLKTTQTRREPYLREIIHILENQ